MAVVVVVVVVVDLPGVRLRNDEIAVSELVQRFGVMGRQHQTEVIDAGRRRRRWWQSLRPLAMPVATKDERDRLARWMTFPVHVQTGQVLGIEAQLDAPTNQRLVDGVPVASE